MLTDRGKFKNLLIRCLQIMTLISFLLISIISWAGQMKGTKEIHLTLKKFPS